VVFGAIFGMCSSRKYTVHTSPAEGIYLPTPLEIPVSFIHFFKCFGLAEPPTPRKFQSLLWENCKMSIVLKWRRPYMTKLEKMYI